MSGPRTSWFVASLCEVMCQKNPSALFLSNLLPLPSLKSPSMPKQSRCRCGGNKACKLCQGNGKFTYEPGPHGWQPFTCPTCQGKRLIDDATAPERENPLFHLQRRWKHRSGQPALLRGHVG